MKIETLKKDAPIAILGFGKEGQSSLSFLVRLGFTNITILDGNSDLETTDLDTSIKTQVGENYLDKLGVFELIIKTPGISPYHEKIIPHMNKLTSQTQIFFEYYKGKVIGVTGTKGKSTISTLLYKLLKEAGYDTKLVGNIGKPVLDEIDVLKDESHDYIIYELSSFMLEGFSPNLHIGFFNNIYECHLDWHNDDFSVYKRAKLNILQNAQIQILHDNFSGDTDLQSITNNMHTFGTGGNFHVTENHIYNKEFPFLGSDDIALEGEHNLENICGVLEVLSHIVSPLEEIHEISKKVLPHFHGLPHRTEHVACINGVDYIDDAIATTPESTIAAINTFDGKLQVLLLGGEDSGFTFSTLRKRILDSSTTHIVAFPDTSEMIFPEIISFSYDSPFEIEVNGKSIVFLKTRSMEDAVMFASNNVSVGGSVLLSNAAPSFSVWKNYVTKGELFQSSVRALKK